MVKIIVDVHEEKSGNAERLRNNGYEVEIASLEVGDYQLSYFFIVERKEYNDLYGSMIGDWDHNIKLQLQRCRDNYKVTVLAIIQSKNLFNATDLKYKQIESFLKHEELFEGTIVKRFGSEDKFSEWLGKTTETLQLENHSNEIPRIKPKVRTKEELQQFFYQGLVDTGIEKAKTIRELFPNPYNFICWLKGLEFEYTKGGNYKGIITIGEPNEIKGFGENWYVKNKNMIFGDD